MHSRVLLVDDDPFTRTVLTSTINELNYELVGAASNAPQALHLAHVQNPDIAIVDLDLGEGPTGIDVCRALRKKLPDLALVMLSTYSHPRLIGHNQAPLPPGTQYVVKSSVTGPEVLLQAIQQACTWSKSSLHRNSDLPPVTVGFESLTPLQVDLMRLTANGLSNAEIAKRRSITEASVEKAIHRLMRDIGMQPDKGENPRVKLAQIYFKATGTVSDRRT